MKHRLFSNPFEPNSVEATRRTKQEYRKSIKEGSSFVLPKL